MEGKIPSITGLATTTALTLLMQSKKEIMMQKYLKWKKIVHEQYA